MIFTKLRFWQVSIMFSVLSLFTINTASGDNGHYTCLDANLSEEQLASVIDCATAPVIVCPSMFIGCPGDSVHPSETGMATATPGDADCPTPFVTWSDELVINAFCAYELHRTWTAEYPGNSNPWLFAECTQIIQLFDNNLPLIKNCPSDITVSMGSDCSAVANWNEPVYTDNCGVSNVTANYSSGDSFPEGVTTVTYTVYDDCGNTNTCSFNVTVVGQCCSAAPVIVCPPNRLRCPNSPPQYYHPNNTGYATATAGAGCSDPVITWSDDIETMNGCPGGMKIIRTWTATDPNDPLLQSSCYQIINLNDVNDPVLTTCPTSMAIITEDPSGAVVNFATPTFQDDCGLASVTSNYVSGSLFPVGCTTVVTTAVDHCGNTNSCTFDICVELEVCNSSPIISCPPHRMRCPGSPPQYYHPNSTGYATAVAGDSNCGNPIVTWSDMINPMPGCADGMQILRTWTAMDPDNPLLTATCVQIINMNDVTLPVVQTCPSDINIDAPDNNGAIVNYSTPTFGEDCGIATLIGSHNSGDLFPIGTTTVTYTATNNCGATISCSFTITVAPPACFSNPSISCPVDAELCINADYSPTFTGYAIGTASGANCDPPNVIWDDIVISSGPCPGAQVIERTWTAEDPNNSNLFSTCTQIIELIDDQSPTVTGCPGDISIIADGNCETAVNWVAPTATDDCGTVSVTSNYSSGALFTAGNTQVIYTFTDQCGNTATCSFNVIVTCANIPCTVPPVITCPANWNSCPNTATHPSTTGYATAVAGLASCDPPVVTYSDAVVSNGPCTGATVIQRTWIAKDPHDDSIYSTCMQIITLSDTTAPAITSCPSDISVIGGDNCDATVSWTPPTATDGCGVASITSNYNPGHVFYGGTTQVVYTITDNCGNTTTCTFNVIVTCNNIGCSVPPVINCPANWTSCGNTSSHPSTTGYATASPGLASCDQPFVTYNDNIVSNGPCAGAQVIHRVWRAEDPNDSSVFTTCTQVITLGDNQAPSFVYCPVDITVDGGPWCDGIGNWSAVTATDNCGLPTISSNYSPGVLLPEGVTTVVYTATDDCGNTATCSFNVTVTCTNTCNTAPSITCPSDITLCPASSYDPFFAGNPSVVAGENCGTPTVTYSDNVISTGPCSGAKVIHRTWTATEPMDNTLTSSCTQIITLSDIFPPGIWECPSNISVTEGTIVTWPEPSADDNCGLLSFTSSHSNGTVFPVGTTTVHYVATDNCGNVSNCSFTVTVTGSGGNFTCPDDIVVQCTAGGGAHVSWNAPTYGGTCNNCVDGNYIPGFIYMGTHGGSQYYCSVNPATWPQASAIASSNGGYLAAIGSASENAFLANILTIQSAWIGLNDATNEGTFTWTNGEPLGYTNWYPQQPNDYAGNQDFVEMLSDGQWNDQYNYKVLEFIMEIPCENVTQVSGPTSGSYLPAGTYEVVYALSPSCGTATCSFNITVESSLSINCVDDVTLQCPFTDTGMYVNWQTPTAETCCQNCNAGGAIAGFVFMGSYNGSYYYCSTSPAQWPTASAICQSNGGYLASVGSAGENNFLANLLTIQSAWIGLNDAANEGNFVWSNGDPLTYQDWYPSQPNDYAGSQDYVEMLSNGEWNDQYNDKSLEFIMEVPGCVNMTQTGGPTSGSWFEAGTTTTISYYATDDCGNTALCSFNVTITQDQCNSGGVNSSLAYIQEVGFGDLWHASGDDGGYADYTDTECASVQAGGSYPLALTPGFGGVPQKCFWKVWVDFNMDGDYLDDGEYIAYGVGSSTVSGTLTMPWTNIWNGTTTMRVACKLNGYPTGPCEVFPMGETEDYCITITGGGDLTDKDDVESRSMEDDFAFEAVILESEKEIVEHTISIYPNPASDFITIQHDDHNEVAEMSIYTITGKLVVNNIDVNEERINLNDLESGIYILRTQYKDGSSNADKFIVQK